LVLKAVDLPADVESIKFVLQAATIELSSKIFDLTIIKEKEDL
jgi:hypothetical protein